jgi:hypothetical protein
LPVRRLPDEGLVDLQHDLALAGRERGIGGDRGRDRVVLFGGEAGLLVERVGARLQRAGDRVDDPLGRISEPTLDLGQVRVGDSGQLGELTHREPAQLALPADDLPE